MNMRKMSIRSALGVIAISLMLSSAFGLFLASHHFSNQTITNAAGMTPLCSNVLASGVSNNGTSGGHEAFTYSYTCGTAATTPDGVTATSQGTFTIATAANYKPVFAIAATGANITATEFIVQYGAIVSGAQWCVYSDARNAGLTLQLTSGTFVNLPSSITCWNGTSSNPTNIIYYDIVIVVDTFGTVSVPAFTVTWTSS